MKNVKVKISGISPMLMHSDRTANPLDVFTREIKKVTGKRNKTEEDYEKISKLEFAAGLYYNGKYYMPSQNIESCLIASAKHSKLGTLIKQAMLVPEDGAFIFPNMDLTPDTLYEDSKYVDMRTVKVGTSKNIRTRPIFHEWEVSFTVYLDGFKMDTDTLKAIIDNAGQYVGLGDYRPRYGRFEVTTYKVK